jgi:hypothetical protein
LYLVAGREQQGQAASWPSRRARADLWPCYVDGPMVLMLSR